MRVYSTPMAGTKVRPMGRKKWALVVMTFVGIVTIFYLATFHFYFRPITPKDIRELSEKLSLNFNERSLVEAVLVTARQVKHPRIRKALLEIHNLLKSPYNQKQFDELLSNYPEVFPREFVLAIDYGGVLGKANIVLKELSHKWPDEPKKREKVVKEILKPLALQTLNSEHWFYRSYALYVLAMLKCKDAVPKMLPLLQDPDPRVQETAQRALQELGYKVK